MHTCTDRQDFYPLSLTHPPNTHTHPHTHTHTHTHKAIPNATSVFLLWPFVPGVRQQGNTNMAASPEQHHHDPRHRDSYCNKDSYLYLRCPPCMHEWTLFFFCRGTMIFKGKIQPEVTHFLTDSLGTNYWKRKKFNLNIIFGYKSSNIRSDVRVRGWGFNGHILPVNLTIQPQACTVGNQGCLTMKWKAVNTNSLWVFLH